MAESEGMHQACRCLFLDTDAGEHSLLWHKLLSSMAADRLGTAVCPGLERRWVAGCKSCDSDSSNMGLVSGRERRKSMVAHPPAGARLTRECGGCEAER